MAQNQYRFIHKTGNITKEWPQPEEEASAANPEPQRQRQMNGGTTPPECPVIIETD